MCSAFYNICLGETLKNVHIVYHNDYLQHYLSNNPRKLKGVFHSHGTHYGNKFRCTTCIIWTHITKSQFLNAYSELNSIVLPTVLCCIWSKRGSYHGLHWMKRTLLLHSEQHQVHWCVRSYSYSGSWRRIIEDLGANLSSSMTSHLHTHTLSLTHPWWYTWLLMMGHNA